MCLQFANVEEDYADNAVWWIYFIRAGQLLAHFDKWLRCNVMAAIGGRPDFANTAARRE
jgi:hypothetical protein